MLRNLTLIGNTIAAIGAAVCLIAALARIAGRYYVLGFEPMTLFVAGTAAMVFACVLLLQRR